MQLEVIYCQPEGNAKPTPLLFVHGAWHGAWCWDEHFLPYFAAHGYHSYAHSLRGHGGSEGQVRGARMGDYIADTVQVMAQVAQERGQPPVLIGHSMGGLIVQKVLETLGAPAAVLLASVPPHGVINVTLRVLLRYPGPFLQANLKTSLYPLIATPEQASWLFFEHDLPEAQLKAYHERLGDESYLAFLGMLIFSLPRPARVHTPLLVLGGEADNTFLPREVEKTGRAYRVKAELFSGVAHDMMLGARWVPVADRILTWLDERGL